MLSDNIIEQGAIFLRNLNINDNNTEKDKWASGTGYGYYNIPYEIPLEMNHYYYQRYTYKFTTTNLSPTWQTMYLLGGMTSGAGVSNPTAGTEYTASGISLPNINNLYTLSNGTMYNGNSSAISGVTSYVKNVLLYDVTELYTILQMYGLASNTTLLKTWCDNNLEYVPRYTNYDISSLLTSQSKVFIKNGTIMASAFVEGDGMILYSINSNIKNYTYFDNLHSGLGVYNNSGGGTVTHSYITATSVDSPFKNDHSYCLQITTNGTASPGAGGFYPSGHTAYANAIFVEKFVAKVPIGYTVSAAYNSLGTGSSVYFISDRVGTGNWKEYTIVYKCGSSGTFSSGGHVYISGTSNTSVTWYVSYYNMCDITGHEELANYKILPTNHSIKSTSVFENCFNNINIIPNGDCTKQETSMIPSGWTYDTSDTVGNGKASIVLPIGASSGYFGDFYAINPNCRYKISLWIKGKNDMTSYLMFIPYYLSNKSTVIGHRDTNYYSNTKTTLASALNVGDTTITLSSNGSNWAKKAYAALGFRSSRYGKSYNDYGSWNKNGSTGCVSSVSGNTVTLDRAYDGTALPAGRCVVESFDGSSYKYPIGKSDLPTDNTWKYIEAYFGVTDAQWDGNNNVGNWYAIPTDVRYIRLGLNLYSNTSTVPLKFCDIKIEEISPKTYGRNENKIQLETQS